MDSKLNHIVEWTLRMVLGGLLCFASFSKFRYPFEFAVALSHYGVFSESLCRGIAVILPPLELIVGLILISGIWFREGIILASTLYIFFLVMVLQAQIRGLDIECGCFHPADGGTLPWYKSIENSFYILGICYLGRVYEQRIKCST